MLDLNDVNVEIVVSEAGDKVWINVDGKCALRVTMPLSVVIEDGREDLFEPGNLGEDQ